MLRRRSLSVNDELDHWLIVGQTRSGKSTLAKSMASQYRKNGIGVVVMDPMARVEQNRETKPEWGADWITNDPFEFLDFVQDPSQCRQCALFCDESGDKIPKHDTRFNWLTTSARHHGHVSHLISWRGVNLNPTLRENCMNLVLFNISHEYAHQMAKEFNCPQMDDACHLPKGHYLYANRFSAGQGAQRGRVWWAAQEEDDTPNTEPEPGQHQEAPSDVASDT